MHLLASGRMDGPGTEAGMVWSNRDYNTRRHRLFTSGTSEFVRGDYVIGTRDVCVF